MCGPHGTGGMGVDHVCEQAMEFCAVRKWASPASVCPIMKCVGNHVLLPAIKSSQHIAQLRSKFGHTLACGLACRKVHGRRNHTAWSDHMTQTFLHGLNLGGQKAALKFGLHIIPHQGEEMMELRLHKPLPRAALNVRTAWYPGCHPVTQSDIGSMGH